MANSELTANAIYIAKRSKVLLPGGDTPTGNAECPVAVVASLAKNFQALGFGLAEPLLVALRSRPEEDVVRFHDETLPILQSMVGADREFRPFYPNFPKQVMEASDAELFFNAMTHYFGFHLSDAMGDPNLVVLPNYEKAERPKLEEFTRLRRWIDLGSPEDFDRIFTQLAGANSSLSEFDKDILRWFAEHRRRDALSLLPESIPQKETLAFLVTILDAPDELAGHLKTATDVLRVAVALSEGDVSLAEPTKFRKFSKRQRRFLLGCLERCGNITEDMLRRPERWIRLGEILHPGDYKHRFPKTLAAFDVIRNDEPFSTFNSQVEAAIARGEVEETASLLAQRPGEFARRLDHALRSHTDQRGILRRFLAVPDRVATPVLLQAWHHFATRNEIAERTFFPKGNAAKVQVKEGPLPPLPEGFSDEVAGGIRRVLLKRFSARPSLGRCYVAESLQSQVVPFAQRSASKSLRTVARGSTFELPEGETVRFFLWWKNGRGRVDIDLTAVMFSGDWNRRLAVAYYNLRDLGCHHSGDVTSAPKGACEFIDVHLPSVVQGGYRYVVMCLYSYTQQPFCDLPECFGGWMVRQEPNSGEVFEPKTVQEKVDVTAATKVCVPVIIDAQSRQVHWADLALRSYGPINNADTNAKGVALMGRAIVGLSRPSLYDLFLMHAEARGELVRQREDAETVFDLLHGTVTPFDTGVILSEYLA